MQPAERVKAAIKQAARWAGYDIRRTDESSTMQAALRRAAAHHSISTVIDVGASDGRWSDVAQHFFPDAAYLLIEAQAQAHEAALRARADAQPRMEYILAAAGDRVGTIHFDGSDPFGGVASEQAFSVGDVVVRMTTIDTEVGQRNLRGPYLLKLDVHGFEQEILRGASDTLAHTSLLVIEAYNFELRPGSLRFHELCAHLDDLGFRPVDLVDVMRRQRDAVLWQFDLVFARGDREEFGSNAYGP